MKNRLKLVAIINLTEDSFSDGGRFLAPESAIAHARDLAKAGADILELGPASSHPDSKHVSAEKQIDRLRTVLDEVSQLQLPISIDATDSRVLHFAMESGVAMLNDIRGFSDVTLHDELADSDASLVVVHSLFTLERAARNRVTPQDVLASINRFFEGKLEEFSRAGIAETRVILDPGMGFFLGSDPLASIAALHQISKLKSRFGRPLFISVSKKSFLREISGRSVEDIGPATLSAELYAAREGAEFLRTHDVAALHGALRVQAALDSISATKK